MGMLSFHLISVADDNIQQKNPEVAQKADKEQPSMEMLEILGGWETDKGDWIDPNELKNMLSLQQEKKE
jgi:hypothetical protein